MTRRRRALVAALGAAAAVVGAAGIGAAHLYRDALRSNVGELSFTNRLRIPPLLDPVLDAEGRRRFDLTIAEGSARLLDARSTATWGLNGPYLGPTLLASAGDRVVVDVGNRLDETTTLHWHGMHLPAAMDGGPHQTIEPGATWSPTWLVDQPAASLWYHAHPDGRTGAHVYRGVAGMFLLDEPALVGVSLPRRYGVDDIPVIVQDKRFTDDGQLDTSKQRFSPFGALGDEIVVNGTHNPYLPVTTSLVRLRLLNASSARTFNIGFSDDQRFSFIAGDAGFVTEPAPMRRLLLAPSERAEIVVRMAPGERAILRSHPTRVGAGLLSRRFAGGDDRFDLLRLMAADHLETSPPLARRLPAPPPVNPDDAVRRRTFRFNHASRINGRSFDPHRIDFTAAAGSTELWELSNGSDNQHVFHVHGASFSVVDYDGGLPPARMAGLKDSLFLPPGTTATLAIRFREFADRDSPYMFHCHLLAHEDHGMMGQFLVTDR